MYRIGHQEEVCVQNRSPEVCEHVALEYLQISTPKKSNYRKKAIKVTRVISGSYEEVVHKSMWGICHQEVSYIQNSQQETACVQIRSSEERAHISY